MATVRLFQQDPYMKQFAATIQEHFEHKIAGDKKTPASLHSAIVLDQTAFYPTSGGQPNDTGVLRPSDAASSSESIKVVDVIENHGKIVHILEKKIDAEWLSVGKQVQGTIDWDRRFDHIQQHHGQHILSQAFIQVAQANTVSFHMSNPECTIDLDTTNITEEIIQKAQNLANSIVAQDLPVLVRLYSMEEAKKLPLRKLADVVEEPVRIVNIGGDNHDVSLFDMQACCGTHPSTTGQVQAILVTGIEKMKKTQTRVYFMCGARVVDYATRSCKILKSMSLKLGTSAEPEEVEKALDRYQAKVVADRKTLAEYDKIVSKHLATEIFQSGEDIQGQHHICCAQVDNRDITGLKGISKEILAMKPSTVVGLLSVDTNAASGTTTPVLFILGSTPESKVDVREVMKHAFNKYPGKGGGSAQFVQGSFQSSADVEGIKQTIMEKLHATLTAPQ